jgi:hypothetical protein
MLLYLKKRQGTELSARYALGKGDNKEMNFILTDENYDEYLKKNDYISNPRIRPDNMDIFEWLSSQDADMSKTPEGRQIIAALQSLDD